MRKPKKNSQQSVQSLDQQATEIYEIIESNDLLAAVNYRNLGEVLRQIQKLRGWNYAELLEHAIGTLGMNKSKFTRALRIYKHCPTVEECGGKTIYEALGYACCEDEPEPKQPSPVAIMPVNARITRKERKAAATFFKRLATPMLDEKDEDFVSRVSLRALSVVLRYGAGELPVEDHKNQQTETKAELRKKLKAGKPVEDLKAAFYDDSRTQQHITDVLTALGLVEGEEGGETQDVSGGIAPQPKSRPEDETTKGETKTQDEPSEKQPEGWAMGKVARNVAHKAMDGSKSLKRLKNAQTVKDEQP